MSQLFGGDLLEALGTEGTAFRLSLRQLWETQWADDGAFLFPCNTLDLGRGCLFHLFCVFFNVCPGPVPYLSQFLRLTSASVTLHLAGMLLSRSPSHEVTAIDCEGATGGSYQRSQ